MAQPVKTSKYRFTRATPCRPDRQFINMAPTSAIWDCANFISCNTKYIAVPWSSLGSVAVLRHDQFGKMQSMLPILCGHQAPVIDLAFHPYDESFLVTASEDCTIKTWHIPEGGLKNNDVAAVNTMVGHGKKVGIIQWHPSARNVLASASVDQSVCLWDVTQSAAVSNIQVREVPWSLNFNLDGSLVNLTTKDKHLSILDPRTGGIVAAAEAHVGSKTQRSVWAKRKNLIVTFGFNKNQFRQAMVWDPRNIAKPLHTEEIDQASSVMMPFMDEDTNMVYVGGKGDGSIKYYHLWDESEVPMVFLSSYQTTDPQKGLCMMPKTMLDVKDCEVARFYKLSAKSMGYIQFHVPRKASTVEFQDDIYSDTFSPYEPAMTADEYFGGANSAPKEVSLRGLFDGTGVAGMPSPVSPRRIASAHGAGAAAPPVQKTVAAPAKPQEPVPPPEKPTVAPVPVAPKQDAEWTVGAGKPTPEQVAAIAARVEAAKKELQAATALQQAAEDAINPPAKHAEAAAPPQAAEAAHKAAEVAKEEAHKPAEPAKEAHKQAEPAREEAHKPAEAAKEAHKPAEAAKEEAHKPAEAAKEEAKPADDSKAADTPKPAEDTKPADPAEVKVVAAAA